MAEKTGAEITNGTGGSACPEAIRRALGAHTTMTLAYTDEDGPQACAVLYAADAAGGGAAGAGPVLYFVTATTTRHGRALAAPGARAAFTAQRDGQEWSGLTGLQGRGRCRVLAGAERAAGGRSISRASPSSPGASGCAAPWSGPRCGSCAPTGCG